MNSLTIPGNQCTIPLTNRSNLILKAFGICAQQSSVKYGLDSHIFTKKTYYSYTASEWCRKRV